MPPRRPPGPRARYPLQFAVDLARDNLQLARDMARYGDVTEITIAGNRSVLLMRPDDIQTLLVAQHRNFLKGQGIEPLKDFLGEGLLTSEGAEHLRERRLAQPAFHRERIANYAAVMAKHTVQTGDRWEEGATLNIHAEMAQLTLKVAGETLFATDRERDLQAMSEVIDLSTRMVAYAILPLGYLWKYVPLPGILRTHAARHRLDEIIYQMIDDRRRTQEDRGDLLSMLASASDLEGYEISDRQLRDQVVTFLAAGYETTAVALSWAWYLLSQYPDAEAQLCSEVDTVLQGRVPTAADVPALPYTRMVFAETLRLYPPAYLLQREAIADCEFGGYHVRAGTTLLASPYLVHRDPRWWPDPERFDPSRWSPEHGKTRPKFSYFPFGGGTRVCIGEQFAWTEGIIVLATLAQRWQLRYNQTHPPAIDAGVTLRPKNGLYMQAVRRPHP